MVKKNQDISIIHQETENLNNIKELQDIQKKLFIDLETLASSNDVNNPEIQARISDILNQTTQLTNIRTNLFNAVKNNYSFLQENVGQSRDTLVEQYVALGVIEAELKSAKNKLDHVYSNKINSERMIEINSYYANRYEHHTKIMKAILLICVAIIFVIFIMKIGWFSVNVASILIIIILAYGFIHVGYMINDLIRRNKLNYDRYDFPFDPNNVTITQNAINQVSNVPYSPFDNDLKQFCKKYENLIEPSNQTPNSSNSASSVKESFTITKDIPTDNEENAMLIIQNMAKKSSLLSKPTNSSDIVPSNETLYSSTSTYNRTD